MTTVYVVSVGGGWDFIADAVFSTEEKAKEYVARREKEKTFFYPQYIIDAFVLDEPDQE